MWTVVTGTNIISDTCKLIQNLIKNACFPKNKCIYPSAYNNNNIVKTILPSSLCRIRSEKAEFVDTMKRVWVGAFDGESGKELKLKIVE